MVVGKIQSLSPSLSLSDRFAKLSSGSRLTKASSDPAAAAIVSSLNLDQRVSSAKIRSYNDSISATNVAAGGLQSIEDINQRQQELATESANGLLSDSQRDVLNKEYQALSEERDRIANSTSFNGQKLLDGSYQQQLNGGDSEISLKIGDSTSAGLGVPGDISNIENARKAIDQLSSVSQSTTDIGSSIGVFQKQVEGGVSSERNALVETSAAISRISDLDLAQEVSELTSDNILNNIGVALAAQSSQLSEANSAVLLG